MLTATDMAQQIVNWEARRDAAGHLKVYQLPANDGGGDYEVAGINQRYDQAVCEKLVRLINAGEFESAEHAAVLYIAAQTDAAAKWLGSIPPSSSSSSSLSALEFFLRDTIFNRGQSGCAKVLQMAIGAAVDGGIGPQTLAKLAPFLKRPIVLLGRLRVARERYEREIVGVRQNFIEGLTNRWDNAFEFSAKALFA